MSYSATIFNVMIASPGDVLVERGLARDIITEWNAIHSTSRAMALMPIGWETHSHPSMEERPQGVLNKQILEGADLLVAIFWTRIGTPTGEAASGSVEEIEKHIKAGKPAMIYFSSAPVRLDSVDESQYRALAEFKSQLKDRGLYETYDTPGDFAEKFRRQLATKINNDLFFHIEGAVDARESPIEEVLTETEKKISTMSKEARDLLSEAALDPNGQILHMRVMSGEHIQTNRKEFIKDALPRQIATWVGALQELAGLGLVIATSSKNQIYRVTREGYDVAELLRS